MREFAVVVKNISKTFISGNKETEVLYDINISFESGKVTFILGPSGCGKTTLISIISGILTPTTGYVCIDDININNLSDDEKVLFRREKIGFVFQQCMLIPSITIAENIYIPLIASGMKSKDAYQQAIKILKKINMEKHADKLPSTLSGGEQQRVGIARSMINNPMLLICDEPTANLDSHTGNHIMHILKENVNETKNTVIVVTHDNRILNFADRIINMNDGRIN